MGAFVTLLFTLLQYVGDGLSEPLSEIEQVKPSSGLVDGEMGHQEAFRNIIQAVRAETRTGIEVSPRLCALSLSVLSIYILTYCLWKFCIEVCGARRLLDFSITFKL